MEFYTESRSDKETIGEYINLLESKLNYPSRACLEYACDGEMIYVNNGKVKGYWCRNCGVLDDE